MIWRAWLAFSFLWFAVVCALVHWSEITSSSAEEGFAFAVTPFVIGFILRRLFAFVVAGR